MKQAFLEVMEWRLKTAGPEGIPSLPTLSPDVIDDGALELMAKLIEEESKETADALRARDLIESADGFADLIWVCLEAALKMGLDLPAIFEEVRRSNLAKVANGVIRREDGKIMKPPGWKPPDVFGTIQFQRPLALIYDEDISMISP